jgi:SAM-dependent methyltransferase
MDLRHRALAGIDLNARRILEIGPLNRPLVPRSGAYQVYYADHCDTASLRKKYSANISVPVEDICEVDFDLSALPLARLGETVERFDVIVASHVIEHVPDLVGWLHDTAECLNPDGLLALVVPDKRYTFDIFRRETETWMLDEAYQEGRSRPSLRQVVEHFTNVVAANAGALWKDRASQAEFRPSTSIEAIEGLFKAHRRGDYIDVHCWIVTPERFRALMQHVMGTYGVPLREHHFEETISGQLEFYAQYRKNAEDAVNAGE